MPQTRKQELDRINKILLEELVEEAQNFMNLHAQWLQTPKGTEDYYNLDGELYASIVHLKVHAGTLQDSLDDVTDLELASS
ncbi:MAG: hypothetical protein AAF267_03765 [Deinococcota bacterium]